MIKQKPGDRKVEKVDSLEFAFRWCPPGDFLMGSPTSEKERDLDETIHHVTISAGFYILETSVTVGMYRAFEQDSGYCSVGETPFTWIDNSWVQDEAYSWKNPGMVQDDSLPVTCLSWDDSVAFCAWLGNKLKKKIYLPTEAQWEYACRAGTTGPYAGYLHDLAWFRENANGEIHPVAQKKPNNWGIHDMHGNIWEWCADWYAPYSCESLTDPAGAPAGTYRVLRGGGWCYFAPLCRSAFRAHYIPNIRYYGLGFRCVLLPEAKSKKKAT